MKKTAFIVENAAAPHVKKGVAMQLEFPQGRYLFLTGYSGSVPGVTEDLISNLAVIPTYAEAAGDLLKIRDDVASRGIIRAFEGRRMKVGSVFDRDEIDYMSSKLGISVSKLSYPDLEMEISAGLSKYRNGESGFTERIVSMWKGKTRYKYSTVNVPVDLWFDETPESLKGFGHYDISRRKDGIIVLSEGKPVDCADFAYTLPGIDQGFADRAGGLKIIYS
jgi:hypothetical protein